MARLARVDASIQLWQDFATVGWRCGDGKVIVCEGGLPEGAELVNSYYDDKRAVVELIFYHESFADVPIGGTLPVIPIEHRVVYPSKE